MKGIRHATNHCGAIVAELSLTTAEHAGPTILRFSIGEGKVGEFREQFFGAGRAEAGAGLVLSPKGWRRLILPRRRERHERSGWL